MTVAIFPSEADATVVSDIVSVAVVKKCVLNKIVDGTFLTKSFLPKTLSDFGKN